MSLPATQFAKQVYMYMTPGIITAVGIGITNIYNIKKSPEYKESMDSIDYIRFAGCIATKSCVYGVCYPFAWISMLSDSGTRCEFERHFIPFSRYGQTLK